MALADPTNITTTSLNDITYAAGNEPWNKTLNQFQIPNRETDVTTYVPDWSKWHGVYRKIPEARSTIDTWVAWIVGTKITALDTKTKAAIKRIEGNSKDTFRMILKNIKRCSKICGNGYAEKIQDKAGRITNLKVQSPGMIKTYANASGIISKYEQITNPHADGVVLATWDDPKEIFDVPNDRIANEIHGIPELEKTYDIVRWKHQSMGDIATVFHRYVYPILEVYAKTDDETELADLATKFEKSVKNMEHRIIPSTAIEKVERVSIPQFSTLDPLPWQKFLRSYWTESSNVPDIIRGKSDEVSLAAGKLNVFAWREKVIYEQIEFAEMIEHQLGLKVKFEEPPKIDVESANAFNNPSNKKKELSNKNTISDVESVKKSS